METDLRQRPRRNRRTESLRQLVQESFLSPRDLLMPLFVIEGERKREEISSMPGIFRLSKDLIVQQCQEIYSLGIPGVVLFPALESSLKNATASEALNDQGLSAQTISQIKNEVPNLLVITDVAMDPYSSEGHDGVVKEDGSIDNDKTLPILAAMAVTQAKAGADIVAPSDMMDGRVGFIRRSLDEHGFSQVGILAYTAKYASAFYGPFREALDSAPRHGDKKTYQMNPANHKEALRELALDLDEGADMVLVKPGLPYLDVVKSFSEKSSVPVAVYNVSGEYSMLRAAAAQGWLDYRSVVFETMMSFKRAGADVIVTYHAQEVATWLSEKSKG